jgi:hypothetical protein
MTEFLTWTQLNTELRDCIDEAALRKMLNVEAKGPNRAQWKVRIHQRLNKLRREREKQELLRS